MPDYFETTINALILELQERVAQYRKLKVYNKMEATQAALSNLYETERLYVEKIS